MTLFFRFTFIVCLVSMHVVQAKNTENYYRNFWNPEYHTQRLNYCTLDGQKCGLQVACLYCQMMGYEKATKHIMDHNVGLTHFILTKKRCTGWECNGFKLIRCEGKIKHQPPALYHYDSHRFAAPRFDHFRVDWCYAEGHQCGKRAAYSFCRRMGYEKAQSFKKEPHVAATKAMGDQALCFGNTCAGFSFISCTR